MEDMMRSAMEKLNSLMETGVNDYNQLRNQMNGDRQALVDLDREFLPIIERIGVTIADMYRLVKQNNPA